MKQFKIKFGIMMCCLVMGIISPLSYAESQKIEINSDEEITTSFPVHLGAEYLKSGLKKALRDLEKKNKETTQLISSGEKLKLGDEGERVLALRERLWLFGDIEAKSDLSHPIFDEDLELKVKSFQIRHGLNPDGVVGLASIKLLNQSVDSLIYKIKANLQRIDNVTQWWSGDYFFVNIPDYRLNVIKNNQRDLGMRVIVGAVKHKTPLFSDEMEYVVLSPKWNVPQSIAVKEILPKLKTDPTYLEKRNYKVFSTLKDADGEPLDTAQIDWNAVDTKNLGFRLVKDAGAENDLGYYKFIFPNQNNVYFHDTNSRRFFQNDFRALSHGCVRLSRPLDLAEYLLQGQAWTRDSLEKIAKSGKEKFVTLEKKWPVHIVYFTAWVDEKNRLNVRDDVYRYDEGLKLQISEGLKDAPSQDGVESPSGFNAIQP